MPECLSPKYEHNYEVVTEGEYEENLILPEWDLDEEAICEFYNVLWVRRENGIAQRVGCGRVFKDRWRENETETIKVTLN